MPVWTLCRTAFGNSLHCTTWPQPPQVNYVLVCFGFIFPINMAFTSSQIWHGTSLFHIQHNSWLYRIKPSVMHAPYVSLVDKSHLLRGDFSKESVNPNQVLPWTFVSRIIFKMSSHSVCTLLSIKMRWLPRDIPDKECDFLEGLVTYGASLFDFSFCETNTAQRLDAMSSLPTFVLPVSP